MKRKIAQGILAVIALVVVAAASCFGGYRLAYGRADELLRQRETFYAEITDIRDNFFSVSGLEENDINYRSEFDFTITDKTELVWRGTAMESSEFDVGDRVAITFTGEIQETYPAHIMDVVKIQLLDDEK